jgi:two-component system sensor histidine kinase BaeS
MIHYIRRHLGAKLFLSYLAIIFVGLVVLALVSQFALPSSFDRHMLRMMGTTDALPGGQGWRMMGWQTAGGSEFRAQLFLDYRAGFNDALKAAGMAALVAAVVLSLILSRSVTGQVQAMSTAAERIAAGQYQERVGIQGMDELSHLASRFNDMAQKLDEIESMRRNLIADVSHELRTPLTAIQGSMEGLIDGVLPASRGTYEQIHEEAKRLNRLVDDLQELSRVEAHAFELEQQPLDIASLVQSAVKRLGGQAAARGVRLEAIVPSELPQTLGDEGRLLQVISNLTNNALQYTPRGGAVTLSAAVVGGELRVSVQDTGLGIALEHLPRIFDRFYRIDKSRSRQEGGGSGIGLTVARALIEAHGGRIWAESPGAGKGSTFTFALPLF